MKLSSLIIFNLLSDLALFMEFFFLIFFLDFCLRLLVFPLLIFGFVESILFLFFFSSDEESILMFCVDFGLIFSLDFNLYKLIINP
jgi:hypothetical protein